MVEINYKVAMCGMICLAAIYIALLIAGKDESTIGFMIVGLIGLMAGVVLPTPKIDKGGMMKW